jgi:hypothetical protein
MLQIKDLQEQKHVIITNYKNEKYGFKRDHKMITFFRQIKDHLILPKAAYLLLRILNIRNISINNRKIAALKKISKNTFFMDHRWFCAGITLECGFW